MRDDDALFDHLRGLERALHSPATRHDSARLDELLADDFLEIGRSGHRYDKTAVLAGFAATSRFPTIRSRAFALSRLAPDIGLLTYRTAIDDQGQRVDAASRVSIWVARADAWRLCFHQATPVAVF